MLNFWFSQTLAVKQAKVPKALTIWHLISVPNDVFDTIFKSRYTKFFYIFDILAIYFD